MAQITVSNAEVIDKLTNDSSFRQKFLADTKQLLDDIGYKIDRQTLDQALEQQVAGVRTSGGARVARTIAIITIF